MTRPERWSGPLSTVALPLVVAAGTLAATDAAMREVAQHRRAGEERLRLARELVTITGVGHTRPRALDDAVAAIRVLIEPRPWSQGRWTR